MPVTCSAQWPAVASVAVRTCARSFPITKARCVRQYQSTELCSVFQSFLLLLSFLLDPFSPPSELILYSWWPRLWNLTGVAFLWLYVALRFIYFYFVCMGILPANICLYIMSMEAKRGIRCCGVGGLESWKWPCGCQESLQLAPVNFI